MQTTAETLFIIGGLGITLYWRGVKRGLFDRNRKHYDAAHIYLVRGDVHAALEQYRIVAFSDPDSHGAWRFVQLGIEHRSHLNDVVSVCHGLLQKRPDDAWLHYALGMALLGTNRLERAREEWTKALALTTEETHKQRLQELLAAHPLAM